MQVNGSLRELDKFHFMIANLVSFFMLLYFDGVNQRVQWVRGGGYAWVKW